ncbi:MAG: protein phosphatase [Acidocella sp. 20-57-95]|nr:MAG: protein phosphatase [Acidocella sp. 20-57-95]OYV62524.1 MAG: protein phosphatase [Acidocella sp. 21-58-7]HQT63792.1 protein phosphatase 2C domain-containing protein [Acidocella sp.]HQU03196.1 protein phosphatase 2C domain-containing protein [Acidocella sp.]
MLQTQSWAATDVGTVRKHNEDNLLCRPDIGLWVVADGAGGHDSGEVASGMIVAELNKLDGHHTGSELLSEVRLTVSRVHAALREEAARRGGNAVIASTFVSLIIRDGHFACLWAGDSRAYLLRGGQLLQVSRDHSLVQELVDSGNLNEADAEHHPHANIITRAVGAEEETLELDKVIGRVEPGDIFLLCSDGLTKTLSNPELQTLLSKQDSVPPPDRLIAAAIAQNVNDNVTAVVIAVQ